MKHALGLLVLQVYSALFAWVVEAVNNAAADPAAETANIVSDDEDDDEDTDGDKEARVKRSAQDAGATIMRHGSGVLPQHCMVGILDVFGFEDLQVGHLPCG